MADQPHTELARDLSLFDITMIGVGAMIGAGIFVLTGIAADAAGPALILSFALNGIVTIFTAMVYAELGSAIPEAGGGYLWVKEGLPGPNAFLSGWMSWFAHAVAGSLYALGFGSYLAFVFEELGVSVFGLEGEIVHKGFAVLIVLLFLYINYRGSSETGLAGNIVTVLKVIILAIFVGSGLLAIFRNPEFFNKFSDFSPEGLGGIVTAMGLTFIAFEGYEIIVQAGEEVKNPRVNIPKAVFYSLAIVVPIYMLVAFVALGAVTPDTNIPTYQWLGNHAELGVAEAARQFMPFGTILLLIGGLLSTVSALNATTFSSTRVAFAMGRDKSLPDVFSEIHPRTRTPHKALAFSGALILFMALVIPIEDVAAATDVMFLLLFLQVNIAVMTIRGKYGDRLTYGYLMPFFPIVPIIGIITKLFLAVFLFNYSPIAWFFALIWIGVGTAGYYVYARPRTEAKARTPVLLEERRAVEIETEERYRVLVPVANPASLPSLLAPALEAARRNDGVITLLHVITVPTQLPLSAGREYLDQGKALLNDALRQVEVEDVPVEAVVRLAHSPHQAIIQTTREKGADLLILGWQGQSRPETAIGRNIDQIIELVSCEVLVVQHTAESTFERILVPIVNTAQLQSALRVAHLLANGNGHAAQINVLHVFSPDTAQSEKETFLNTLQGGVEKFRQNHGLENGTITVQEQTASDPVTAIVEAARDRDAVILGATRDNWLQRRFVGSKPAQIAQHIAPPVVLVRPATTAIGFGFHHLVRLMHGEIIDEGASAERELEEQGLLRPKSERTVEELHSDVNTGQLLLVGILGLVTVALMYVGDGNVWTWIGALGFFVVLGWFTWLSAAGVGRHH